MLRDQVTAMLRSSHFALTAPRRDMIPTIRLPTRWWWAQTRIFSVASQVWVAAQIPGAELEIFEAGQGGGHFMFHEDAPRFNARVASFLTA